MITVMSYCFPIERGLYSIVHTFLECPTCSGKYAQLTYLTNDMTHDIPHQQERLLHRTLVLIIINTLVCMSNCYISIKTDLQTSNNNDVIVHHVSSDRAAITNIKQKQFFIFGQ